MKTYFLPFILLLLCSCSENHYYDGKYKATVYREGSLFSIHQEIITVKGNEILDEKYTIAGRLAAKTIVKCVQFQDRIEFNAENGIVKILTVEDDGNNLRLDADVVFKRLGDDFQTTQMEDKSVVSKGSDGTYRINDPNRKKSSFRNNETTDSLELFQGQRIFQSVNGETCNITIRNDLISLSIVGESRRLTFSGYIKNGQILTRDGKVTSFKLEDGVFFEHDSEDSWNEFFEIGE